MDKMKKKQRLFFSTEGPSNQKDVKLLSLEQEKVSPVATTSEEIQNQSHQDPLSVVPSAHSSVVLEESSSRLPPTRQKQYEHLDSEDSSLKGKTDLKLCRYRVGIHEVCKSSSLFHHFKILCKMLLSTEGSQGDFARDRK